MIQLNFKSWASNWCFNLLSCEFCSRCARACVCVIFLPVLCTQNWVIPATDLIAPDKRREWFNFRNLKLFIACSIWHTEKSLTFDALWCLTMRGYSQPNEKTVVWKYEVNKQTITQNYIGDVFWCVYFKLYNNCCCCCYSLSFVSLCAYPCGDLFFCLTELPAHSKISLETVDTVFTLHRHTHNMNE